MDMGEGVKTAQILWTSFMDGPLVSCVNNFGENSRGCHLNQVAEYQWIHEIGNLLPISRCVSVSVNMVHSCRSVIL